MSDVWATTWPAYVRHHSDRARPEAIAERAGMHAGTVRRWYGDNSPRPSVEHVVAFARAYQRPPAEALIAAGYLTPDDLGADGKALEIETSLRNVPDAALIEELTGRLAHFRQLLAGHDPQDGLVTDDWSEDPGMNGMQNRN